MAGFIQKVDSEEYQRRIQKHKRQKLFIICGITLVVAIVCVFLVNAYLNRTFHAYTVSKSIDREDAGAAQYLSYKGQALKVSRDGASAIDPAGNITFNGSYDLKNPQIDICEDYIAVADKGGYDIYVFDGTNSGKKITVTLPILQVQVARQGVIAVLMEDKDSNVIQLYRTDEAVDNLLVDRRTYVEDNGFPVDFTLSDDGKKLVTAYVHVQNGVLQNHVTFYNFSEVGQSNMRHMIGMVDYQSTIVPKVSFLGNDAVCTYLENGFELYAMKETFSSVYKEEFEKEIVATFHTDSYVGFVLNNFTEESKYQVVVYDVSGKKVLSQDINYNFDTVTMSGEEILFYSSSECHVLKLNGVEKFSYEFNGDVTAILPINNYNKYFLIDNNAINVVKLTEE